MSEDSTWDALEVASTAVDRLLAADLSGVEDVMPAVEVGEELARKVAAFQQNVVAEVVAREGAEAGGPSAKQLLQARLRLSPREAKSRIERAADLAPRRALTGEALPAKLPATAAAQAEGALSVEQVQVIQHTMKLLPAAVDPGTWAAAEAELAGHARRFDPKRLGILATRLRACLDPDGTLATELEQIERRELSFARDVEAALRMACDAELIPTVFNDGQVLTAGRTRRLATKRQRDALIARDRGCAAPDCDAPPAWTQAHHVVHWAHGGKTDLNNLVLLCGRHHRAIHTGHWTITTTADGMPEARPPPGMRAA